MFLMFEIIVQQVMMEKSCMDNEIENENVFYLIEYGFDCHRSQRHAAERLLLLFYEWFKHAQACSSKKIQHKTCEHFMIR